MYVEYGQSTIDGCDRGFLHSSQKKAYPFKFPGVFGRMLVSSPFGSSPFLKPAWLNEAQHHSAAINHKPSKRANHQYSSPAPPAPKYSSWSTATATATATASPLLPSSCRQPSAYIHLSSGDSTPACTPTPQPGPRPTNATTNNDGWLSIGLASCIAAAY